MNASVANLIKGARRLRISGMRSTEAQRHLVCAWQEHRDRRPRCKPMCLRILSLCWHEENLVHGAARIGLEGEERSPGDVFRL